MAAGQHRANKSDMMLLPAGQTRGRQLHARFCSQLIEHTTSINSHSGKRNENDNYCVGLSGVYFAVISWPGVKGEDVMCCGSKSSRQVTQCFTLSLCGSVAIAPRQQRCWRLFLCLPHQPARCCLFLGFAQSSEPMSASKEGHSVLGPVPGHCLPGHPPQHKVPYKTGQSGGHSALIAWLVHKVPSTDFLQQFPPFYFPLTLA